MKRYSCAHGLEELILLECSYYPKPSRNSMYSASRCQWHFFFFLGPHPQHMEVPRLGDELELQLLATATATATWDPSCVCDLHHSSWQCRILNPLSKARDQTHILMDTCHSFPLCHNGSSIIKNILMWVEVGSECTEHKAPLIGRATRVHHT